MTWCGQLVLCTPSPTFMLLYIIVQLQSTLWLRTTSNTNIGWVRLVDHVIQETPNTDDHPQTCSDSDFEGSSKHLILTWTEITAGNLQVQFTCGVVKAQLYRNIIWWNREPTSCTGRAKTPLSLDIESSLVHKKQRVKTPLITNTLGHTTWERARWWSWWYCR